MVENRSFSLNTSAIVNSSVSAWSLKLKTFNASYGENSLKRKTTTERECKLTTASTSKLNWHSDFFFVCLFLVFLKSISITCKLQSTVLQIMKTIGYYVYFAFLKKSYFKAVPFV